MRGSHFTISYASNWNLPIRGKYKKKTQMLMEKNCDYKSQKKKKRVLHQGIRIFITR